MSWAQRLKRVFGIDSEICRHCGGGMRLIAGMPDHSIEDPVVIQKIWITCRSGRVMQGRRESCHRVELSPIHI